MSISGTSGLGTGSIFQTLSTTRPTTTPDKQQTGNTTGFGDRISDAFESVAKAQEQAKTSAQNFELGIEDNLTKVMVDQQISSLGFQMTLNVRNKALGAYKDIMNMPV